MEFSKEKNQKKFRIFSKRSFLVLFFLLILVITFFPTHPASALTMQEFKNFMQTADTTKSNADVCTITDLPRCFILVIFRFSGFLLTLSGTVFTWIINADNIKLILNGTSTSNPLYELWAYVRDLLNMAFIMVLLFSAFCTIFQVEQYNYKKLLWKIVLMALLVNFSFPITRFIIDASNILMYSLIKSDLTTSFTTIASSNGALGELLTARNFPDNSSLLVASVMIFMLAITLLAVGILLLIRMIALAILIIFSPVAFAGSIIPGVSAQASKWWDNLIKYSFFGPIMIFGVIIAVKLMTGIGASLKTAAVSAAVGTEANLIGNVAYMALPIVLLWVVIGVAQKSSIAGAGAVMGAAQGAIKWAGKAPFKAGKFAIKKGAEATGIPGGLKQKWTQFKKTGPLGSDAREKIEAKWAEKGPLSVKGAINEHARKKANEKRDEWKKTGPPPKKELQEMLNDKNTDNIKARAAALELAESTGFDGNYANYEQALKVNAGDQSGIEMLNEKTKKKGRDLILAHKINKPLDSDGNPNTATLQDELAKLDNADFGSINFKNLVANTTDHGHNRGGTDSVKSFFTGIDADRKIQISRRINKDNETYLEGEHLFAAKNQQEKPAEKPAPGTKPGARAGFV